MFFNRNSFYNFIEMKETTNSNCHNFMVNKYNQIHNIHSTLNFIYPENNLDGSYLEKELLVSLLDLIKDIIEYLHKTESLCLIKFKDILQNNLDLYNLINEEEVVNNTISVTDLEVGRFLSIDLHSIEQNKENQNHSFCTNDNCLLLMVLNTLRLNLNDKELIKQIISLLKNN